MQPHMHANRSPTRSHSSGEHAGAAGGRDAASGANANVGEAITKTTTPSDADAASGGASRQPPPALRAGYALLGLLTYFAVGPKEARAWTITKGTRAPAAAGVIHTDFEKGFIRSETIAFDDYVTLKGESGAREAGRLRLEGKEYIVKDGDVLHFRFNL